MRGPSGFRVIGVDPGKTGAIAAISLDGAKVRVWDVPTMQLMKSTKKATIINLPLLNATLDECLSLHDPESTVAYVEWVGASPQMGVSSAFSFGEGFGALRMGFTAHGVRVVLVAPHVWKKAMRLKVSEGGKDASRAKACEMFVRDASLFSRGLDDGRAEAALIARYGWEECRKQLSSRS